MWIRYKRLLRICTLVFLLCIIIYAEYKRAHHRNLAPTKPRLSIITSVWNGDEFIKGFLANITQQTLFKESELILINANSPGNEEPIIKRYMERYPNIIYLRLPQDPGLYSIWNRAIQIASADFVTNANLDDRSRPDSHELHVKELEKHPEIDLVYSGFYVTFTPNDTFDSEPIAIVDTPEFSVENTVICLPGPRPVWRKSMHTRFGYFDETFVSAADYAMWVRAVSLGSTFKKIPGYLTLFYLNPDGVSTNNDQQKSYVRDLENELIIQRYNYLWEQEEF